ncbi:hydantoinase B/oxoprolinase, partial [Hortaea werneckii]
MSPHKVTEIDADGLKVKIAIDRGGTFTDCLGIVEGREDNTVVKLLSQDPSNYDDAPIEGIRRILEQATGRPYPRGQKLDVSGLKDFSIRMGTTVATNTLLERKGERSEFLVSKGFKDLLRIGNQSRPKLFDLNIVRPDVLYDDVVEVDERVTIENYQQDPWRDESLSKTLAALDTDPQFVRGRSNEIVRILKTPDIEVVRADLQSLFDNGYRSLAVCSAHSYTYSDHELLVEKLAREIGFPQISLSSQLLPMIKMTSRGASSTADAYLTPVIRRYVEGFREGFSDGLMSDKTRCEFMQSDGGLADFERFTGLKAILSGPAGGVFGHARTSYDPDHPKPVIGFDMGGTSTLDINTIAAGGGSILFWRHGLFVVGPDSAGAHPGPACYRKGGPLTVTDANLFLGRLLPDHFPKIFGPSENEALDVEVVKDKFEVLARHIYQETGQHRTAKEIALGFIQVANESMAKPIRALTEARGFDTSAHNLACFGGAGGQHACAIASSLGIQTVIIHRYSSILSAYGMALADVVHESQEPSSCVLDDAGLESCHARIAFLKKKVTAELIAGNVPADQISFEVYLNLRRRGTDNLLMILEPSHGDFVKEFIAQHRREFSFDFPERDIFCEDVRVRGIGHSLNAPPETPQQEMISLERSDEILLPDDETMAYFADGGEWKTPVYFLRNLKPGQVLKGPSILLDSTQTLVVEPKARATILSKHVVLNVPRTGRKSDSTPDAIDPIRLSIFGHRFMSIAEQMGRTFQKTSVSTNIKERLDFSCALFSPEGRLVANAPHVPVHLGSMEYAVRFQRDQYASQLKPGDVICSNHPLAGGTHLPDITIITPIWNAEQTDIIFYVASRGHHAEIGGTQPGSMPSDSKLLYEEGAMTMGFKIVSNGIFDEDRIHKFLCEEPASFPGCSATRTYNDNVSDLQAAISANQKAAQLIDVLVQEYSLPVVHRYMNAINKTAEMAVRQYLMEFAKTRPKLGFTDYMDDGTPIVRAIDIDSATGSASFDFTGTGKETFNCLNAAPAIAHSAIIYTLRCLIGVDIPLNQGCLAPISVNIPEGTLLNPSGYAAVCAGNPITSQRITDVCLGAFRACAASQGCCNIISFGMGGRDEHGVDNPGFGVGETICGGSGAGPGWHGTSGVHIHMTNTRITDCEVYELRYPVILRQFSIREGSGGCGRWRGGDGVVRELEFRMPLS